MRAPHRGGNLAAPPALHRLTEGSEMTRKGKAGLTAAGVLALTAGIATGLALAGPADGKWIHIRVVDGDDRQSTVKVNMPVTALISMADAIEDEHFKDGHVQ